MDGDGKCTVTLTAASARVLEKVPGLQKWKVSPPMSRGSKMPPAVNANPKAKAVKIPKAKSKKPQKIIISAGEVTENDIRRTKQGRDAIRSFMKQLLELDDHFNGTTPVFDFKEGGVCRMQFPGAEKMKWEELLEKSPLCFESMQHVSLAFGDMFLKTPDR